MNYIEVTEQILTESDINLILEKSFSEDKNKVLIYESAISETILDLKSGICGIMLQKFVNYNIKTAFIVDEKSLSNRFSELVLELNNTSHFNFLPMKKKL